MSNIKQCKNDNSNKVWFRVKIKVPSGTVVVTLRFKKRSKP